MKGKKGITLISLMVTIVILIILASVAIFSGIHVINSSKLTAFTTEMKIMQTQVNSLYQKWKNKEIVEANGKQYTGDQIVNELGQAIDNNIQSNLVFTSNASGITNKDGYRYFNKALISDLGIEGVKQEFFINIQTRSIISYKGLNYEGQMYYTLEQLPKSLYNVENEDLGVDAPTFSLRKNLIADNRWKIVVEDIKYKGSINKWQVQYKLETESNWNTTDDMSFIVEQEGVFVVKIVNDTVSSAEKKIDTTINDKVAPLASIYEDYDTVNRKARVSVDVADYESGINYVELPDGTKKYIEDEKTDNVKIIVIENRVYGTPLEELLKGFNNVTFNDSITQEELVNSDYDVVISYMPVWSSHKPDMLNAAFKAGKNIITVGNDSVPEIDVIENTIFVSAADNTTATKKVTSNEISDKLEVGKVLSDGVNLISEPIEGFENWCTYNYNGQEYTAMGMYEEKGARWFHSSAPEVSLQEVFPYLIRKLTRISTATYEVPGAGTYAFRIYDNEGNCTVKTITTGEYAITYDYNEQILQNGDFSNGTVAWTKSGYITYNLDESMLYKGKATVRLHTEANGTWNCFFNSTIANQYYGNTLYKMHMIVLKDDTSSYGGYKNNFRMYMPEYDGDNRISDRGSINNVTLNKNKVWTKVEKEFTTAGTRWTNVYMPFSINAGESAMEESTLWLAEARVERIQKANIRYGNTIGTLPTITSTGKTFQGWFTQPSGGTQIKTTDKVEPGNVTYYAHWK